MKENPPTPKLPFTVHIDGIEFRTFALNERGAISNAAFRYAKQEDEDVKLVMWKIREGQLDCYVEDRKEEI